MIFTPVTVAKFLPNWAVCNKDESVLDIGNREGILQSSLIGIYKTWKLILTNPLSIHQGKQTKWQRHVPT